MNRSHLAACALIVTGIFIASNLYLMIPHVDYLSETYNVTKTTASLASSLFIFPYAIGLFCFGLLADRLPHRLILLTGILGLVCLTFVIGTVDNFGLFLLLRVLQGLLAACFAPTSFAYTFLHYDGKEQAFVIAIINTGFLFAGIFGQMYADAVFTWFNFSAIFYGCSLCYLLCWIGLASSLAKPRDASVTKPVPIRSIVSFFRFSPLQKLYVTAFFLLLTVIAFYGSLELYLSTHPSFLPYSLQTFRLIGLLGIIPSFFAGPLVEKWGARPLLVSMLLLMSVGFLLPSIAFHPWTLLLASIAMIASTSLTIPMVIMLIGFYGNRARATAISMYSFILLTGASAGSILATFIPVQGVIGAALIGFVFLAITIQGLKIHQSPLTIQS
ncbi:hypothetical protein N781_15030 [Pontibacillus halophilus JSM 076056 = DSM 19796]|uniref:Major facilitator superfamily (MFS) profile domain-containing protein n=1 Tax=Pontibacillus halophilus JSM 076056 = DSM 19796 TaxID=1385510 RepID=A0A0A5GL98_9BACI|nr:MFS transporter [Pontibacillus halophilus]KGX92784.1 hypothetical protein N781_15030 [Pontibacillus halophilus JSM 076056 = DSM 19796]